MCKKYGKINNGIWKISSETDDRFNFSGVGKVGWLHIPTEAKVKIKVTEITHDVLAPDDLLLIYTKM